MRLLAKAKTRLARHFLLAEFCHLCGRRVRQVWWASDNLWPLIAGSRNGTRGVVCIPCFDREADRREVTVRWLAVSETTYRRAVCGTLREAGEEA